MCTADNYFNASLLRHEDSRFLQDDEERIIGSIYLAGLSVECMIRAHKERHHIEAGLYDRHDLRRLFDISGWSREMTFLEEAELLDKLTIVNKFWHNGFRYYSNKQLKQFILSKVPGSRYNRIGDLNNYVRRKFTDFFEAVVYIIEKGGRTWN